MPSECNEASLTGDGRSFSTHSRDTGSATPGVEGAAWAVSHSSVKTTRRCGVGEGTGFRNPTAATNTLDSEAANLLTHPAFSLSRLYLFDEKLVLTAVSNTWCLLHGPANCLLWPSQRGSEPDALMTQIILIRPISERSTPTRGERNSQGRRRVVKRYLRQLTPNPAPAHSRAPHQNPAASETDAASVVCVRIPDANHLSENGSKMSTVRVEIFRCSFVGTSSTLDRAWHTSLNEDLLSEQRKHWTGAGHGASAHAQPPPCGSPVPTRTGLRHDTMKGSLKARSISHRVRDWGVSGLEAGPHVGQAGFLHLPHHLPERRLSVSSQVPPSATVSLGHSTRRPGQEGHRWCF